VTVLVFVGASVALIAVLAVVQLLLVDWLSGFTGSSVASLTGLAVFVAVAARLAKAIGLKPLPDMFRAQKGGVAMNVTAVLGIFVCLPLIGRQQTSPSGAVLAQSALAAGAEEIFFRGVLLFGIATCFGKWPALLVQAGMFAVAHAPVHGVSIQSSTTLFWHGTFYGWAALKTGTLWLPIAIHWAWNVYSDRSSLDQVGETVAFLFITLSLLFAERYLSPNALQKKSSDPK
jgi:membrane protease YdiL (CAAX protease family)